LADKESIDPALLQNVLEFYRDPQAPYATRKNPADWQKLQAALEKLRSRSAAPAH
jgi:hypothetical protein